MKIHHIKQKLFTVLHLVFWFISVNLWNVVLNPSVESVSVFQGFEVGWDLLLFLNFIFLVYISLPFIWLARGVKLWIKIAVSVVFLLPLGYVIFELVKPDGNREDVIAVVEYFLKNFMYVIVFHLTIVTAVYLHLKQLIPRLLNRSRFVGYAFSILGLIAGAAILNFSLYNYFIDKLFPSLYYISYFRIWELILIIAGYVVFTGILFLMNQYAQLLIEKREAARNELSALKAQINPHFLFNNLNTIYSMASKKDERTTDVILKLSEFLRYVLYDTSSEAIDLQKEVEMIATYVGLQKERVNPEITHIELHTSGEFAGTAIAPLLLLPLAENCFKHGIGKSAGTIRIEISLIGKQLVFRTENQIALREKPSSEEGGGLGIQNVKKRLELIYPGRHSIGYEEKDGLFRLEMKIDLEKR